MSSKNAWTEKVEWIEKHIPESTITLTQDKGKGLAIIPTHPWNEEFSHPNVIRYNRTNLEQVKKALKLARNRKYKEPLDLRNL